MRLRTRFATACRHRVAVSHASPWPQQSCSRSASPITKKLRARLAAGARENFSTRTEVGT